MMRTDRVGDERVLAIFSGDVVTEKSVGAFDRLVHTLADIMEEAGRFANVASRRSSPAIMPVRKATSTLCCSMFCP